MVAYSARSTWESPCGLSRTAEDDDTERDRTRPLYPGLAINSPGHHPKIKLGSAMHNLALSPLLRRLPTVVLVG